MDECSKCLKTMIVREKRLLSISRDQVEKGPATLALAPGKRGGQRNDGIILSLRNPESGMGASRCSCQLKPAFRLVDEPDSVALGVLPSRNPILDSQPAFPV